MAPKASARQSPLERPVMWVRDNVTFLSGFLRRPGQVGAILPSSPQLAEAMVEWIDWGNVGAVAEFGPGTGVFTEVIQRRKPGDAAFFAVERSPQFARLVRQRCPEVHVFEDSVQNVAEHCAQVGVQQLDAVICGLPWASFPADLQRSCLDALSNVLRPGGQFATFAYWQGMLLPAAHRFRKLLGEYFDPIQRSHTVWRNVPPAFVYRCRRRP